MKKIFFALLAVVFIGSFCFIRPDSAEADEPKTITGKVESVQKVMGKPPKWLYAIVTVVNDGGEKTAVYVPKSAAVTDASGQDMTEGGKKLGAIFLKKGARVEVEYVTGTLTIKSHNECIAIRCLD